VWSIKSKLSVNSILLEGLKRNFNVRGEKWKLKQNETSLDEPILNFWRSLPVRKYLMKKTQKKIFNGPLLKKNKFGFYFSSFLIFSVSSNVSLSRDTIQANSIRFKDDFNFGGIFGMPILGTVTLIDFSSLVRSHEFTPNIFPLELGLLMQYFNDRRYIGGEIFPLNGGRLI